VSGSTGEVSLHTSVQRAVVAKAELRQLDVLELDDAPTVVLAHAFTATRLWGYMLDTALDGFYDGYHRPHDGRASLGAGAKMRVAQQALRTRVDSLIEKRGGDVALLALSVEGSVLHVTSAGSLQAYLYRHRTLRRLGQSEAEVPEGAGILKLGPSWSAESIEPNDLVFATAGSVCTEATLDKLTHALDRERGAAPELVVQMLNEAATKQRRAGAALALRMSPEL
jgi:hypothetical protein